MVNESKWSRTELIKRGGKVRILPFYNEGASDERHVLNQWHCGSFVHDGVKYHCAEQAMMAEKALLFGDTYTFSQIMEAGTPYAAKSLGRTVKPFNEDKWVKHRLSIVAHVNISKFVAIPEARDYLLSTGDDILVEASPVDRIWGVGLSESNPMIYSIPAWNGLNLLGEALMITRDVLRENELEEEVIRSRSLSHDIPSV